MLRRPAAWISIGDLAKPGNHGANDDHDTGVPRGIFRLTTLADNSREITPEMGLTGPDKTGPLGG